MDELQLEPALYVNNFDAFLTSLEYSNDLSGLGVTFTLFSSDDLETDEEEYDSLGFCFTHTIKMAGDKSVHNAGEVFVALNRVYLASLRDPSRKSHMENEVIRINIEIAEELAVLVGHANPKATWHQGIDLSDPHADDTARFIHDIATQSLQDNLFFNVHISRES